MVSAVCCVYQIRNTVNDDKYIGSAVNFEHRKRCHLSALRRCKHHSRKLQKAWDEYGELAFAFEVIEECLREERLDREQFHLTQLGTAVARGYNVSPSAHSPMLGRKHSPETLQRMSKSRMNHKQWTPEARAKMSAKRMGHEVSEESRKKISISHKGKSLSAEHRARLCVARAGKKPSLGMRHTDEFKAQQSVRSKAWWSKRKAEAALGDSLGL